MTRPHDTTEPSAAPDTDPGEEPETESASDVIDPNHPPIRNPKIAALLRGLHASPHPRPQIVPVTDGQLTAKWASEAHEVKVAHPTPDQQPRVLLECTEETPLAELPREVAKAQRLRDTAPLPLRPSPTGTAPMLVVPRAPGGKAASEVGARVNQNQVSTAPSLRRSAEGPWFDRAPGEDGGFPEEGVERAANRVTVRLPGRKKRHLGLVVGAALAVVATIGAAALMGRDRGSPPPVRATASPTAEPLPKATVPTPAAPTVTQAVPVESAPPLPSASAPDVEHAPAPPTVPRAATQVGPSRPAPSDVIRTVSPKPNPAAAAPAPGRDPSNSPF